MNTPVESLKALVIRSAFMCLGASFLLPEPGATIWFYMFVFHYCGFVWLEQNVPY